MKKTIILSIISFITFFGISQEYYSDVIIVKVKSEFRSSCSNEKININSLTSFFNNKNISSVNRMFKNIPIQHDLKLRSDISLLYRILYNGSELIETIDALNKFQEIEYAELEYKNTILDVTNDPLADSITGNQPALDMHNVYQAWDITKGDSNILIAVSDAGTSPTHEDLIDNIYKNKNDTIDNIDNDNDGLIDNYIGWDFSENNNDPTEVNGRHGTAVCGIAGATTNNGIGLSSIGYNCKIVPLKSSPDNNPNSINRGYEALQFSASKGYDIINLSWGCPNCYSQSSQDIVNNAVLDNNIVIIAAAGNQEKEIDYYPASYDNVLSVSSVDTNYEKWVNRSWHYYVDLVTHGRNVLTTNSNGSYSQENGTSFSAPMVASAAGLVKDVFPSYNAVQIMEQLRVTTDSIYHLSGNQIYTDKLGTGSMNVLKAVSNTTTPAIRNIKNYKNDFIFATNGDTAKINGEFVNLLNPSSNLVITLSSPSPYITVIDSIFNVGVINTFDTIINLVNEFSFQISDTTPILQDIWLKFSYNDNEYHDFQYKKITINPDFINIEENQISTSANSTGNFGFTSPIRNYGNGVLYNNSQLLYEAGLMISCIQNDTVKVSDNVRVNSSTINQDFYLVERIHEINSLGFSDFKATTLFRDTLLDSLNNVGIEVRSNFYAWNNSPDHKYIIVEYEISNRNNDTLKDIYSGIYADWDILNVYSNEANWDFEGGFGYANSSNDSIYVGIKPLWPYYGTYYAMNNAGGNSIGIYDGFSDLEKHQTLSLVNEKIIAGNPPTDISHVVGMNIGNLAPGQTKITAFAIMVGDSLNDLKTTANAAQIKFGNQVNFTGPSPIAFDTVTCENTFTQIRVSGGDEYLLYGGENDYLVLDDSLPLTTLTISDTTIYYVSFPNGDFPGLKTPVTVFTYLPEVSFWLEPDTIYLEDRNYTYPHNTSPYYDDFIWSFDNGVFSNANNPSANYSDSGTYFITLYLTDSNNCSNYLSLPLIVLDGSKPSSIENNKPNIIVFPNPTTNQLLINNLCEPENQIQLIDIKGNILLNTKTKENKSRLDLSIFPSGSYSLKINEHIHKVIKK